MTEHLLKGYRCKIQKQLASHYLQIHFPLINKEKRTVSSEFRMNGYTQINVQKANQLYQRHANQNESNSSLTYKVHDTHLMHLVFLD